MQLLTNKETNKQTNQADLGYAPFPHHPSCPAAINVLWMKTFQITQNGRGFYIFSPLDHFIMEMLFLPSTSIWRLRGQTAKIPGHLSECKPVWPHIPFFLTLQAVSDVSHHYAHHDQVLLKFRHSTQQNIKARYQPTSKSKTVYFLQLMLSSAGSCPLSSLLSQAALSIPGPLQRLLHPEVSRAGQGDGEKYSSELLKHMS